MSLVSSLVSAAALFALAVIVQMDTNKMYNDGHEPSAAGRLGGFVLNALDGSSRKSNKALESAPQGVEFIGPLKEEWYKALKAEYERETTATNEEGFPHNTILKILLSFLGIFLGLPLFVVFRDANATGGVYVLAAIASAFQLTGLGRSIFLSTLAVLFYCWMFAASLRPPNNEILSFFEALKFEGAIWLLQRVVGVERCNPYTGRLTKTKYLHTFNDFHSLNHVEKLAINIDNLGTWWTWQSEGQYCFQKLKIKLTYVPCRYHESHGLLITETETGSFTNNYIEDSTYFRLQACLHYISLYPSNITCSNRMSSENGVACAHAIRIRELILSLEKSEWIIQYKLHKEIAIKG